MRWLVLLLLAGVLTVLACQEASHLTLNRRGNQLYSRGDYAAALEAYRQAQVQRPDLPQLSYNAGNALYRLGDYQGAAELTRRALSAEDAFALAQVYYSLGNQYFHLGMLAEALAAYKNALVYNPDDQDAKFNLEVVLLYLQAAELAPTPTPQPAGGQDSPNASPTPGAQEEPSPGQPTATPTPGTGADRDSASEAGGEASAGGPAELSQVEQALNESLALGEAREFSVEEALEILNLLAERERLKQAREQPPAPRSGYRDW